MDYQLSIRLTASLLVASARVIAGLAGALGAMIESPVNAANTAMDGDYSRESDNQFDF
jgi:hypothetical protein